MSETTRVEWDEEMDGGSGETYCHWCGGDGYDDCDDPIECTYEHDENGQCRCKSCGGSGLAKDMTIW